ncbi:MAG: glycosyltransferase family 4 protein [Thaumarchaeota archaeon]|nr:glycosyltransferase family 4 protein [Candidatus Terraquivivens yellowstonensis]
MRILLLSPRVSGVGGIAQHVRRLARGLREAGHDVELISIETLGVRLRKGLANPGYGVLAALKSPGDRFDIVHGHNLPSAPAVRFAKARVKVLTLHGIYSRQIKLLYGGMLGSMVELFERWILRGIDAVTAVSLEAVRYYRSLGIEAVHIPNAIDLSELPNEAERVSEPQITYLGRLSKEKGVDILVKAALMGLRGIVIAGDGPMRPLVERAAQKGLLKFLGPLPRAKALKILTGSDVVVLPSREEGVSTVLLEAMALKVPIVATRVGGNIEVLRDNEDALLVNPDPSEVKEAVTRLLENKSLAKKLTENAYQRLLKDYEWKMVLEKYLKLYERLMITCD